QTWRETQVWNGMHIGQGSSSSMSSVLHKRRWERSRTGLCTQLVTEWVPMTRQIVSAGQPALAIRLRHIDVE
ncbi:MAG TPA: hypothetical protein VKZ53_23875, partial [Candidatus Angelobacter sp.]|nr:hypothetical protein [Candidatus Angelobacter sp.]